MSLVTNDIAEMKAQSASVAKYFIADAWHFRQKNVILPAGHKRVFHICQIDEEGKSSLVSGRFEIADTSIAEIDEQGIFTAKIRGQTTLAAYVVDRQLRQKRVAVLPVIVEREALKPLIEIPASRYFQRDGVLMAAKQEQSSRAVLRLTGDLMCEAKRIPRAKSLALRGGFKDSYDFRDLTAAVAPYIGRADFSIGNLESVLADQFAYFSEQPFIWGAPLCNAPSTFLDAIRAAGFDAVVMANNHVLDCGEFGLSRTLEKVESYGLFHTGVYPDKREEGRFLLVDIHGIRVAIINYNTLFNGVAAALANEVPALANVPMKENFERHIAEARSHGAEFVIVFMHWGMEENSRLLRRYPREAFGVTQELTDMAQNIADAGADYIVGAGAHALHRYEVLVSKEGRRIPCAYGIGNFISDMDGYDVDGKNDQSMILEISLTREGEAIRCEDAYIPCWMEEKDGAFFTRVITETDGAAGQVRKSIAAILGEGIQELPEARW